MKYLALTNSGSSPGSNTAVRINKTNKSMLISMLDAIYQMI